MEIISLIVPIQEEKRERHDQEEEEHVHPHAGLILDGLAQLLVPVLDVLRRLDGVVVDQVDVVPLLEDLLGEDVLQLGDLDHLVLDLLDGVLDLHEVLVHALVLGLEGLDLLGREFVLIGLGLYVGRTLEKWRLIKTRLDKPILNLRSLF